MKTLAIAIQKGGQGKTVITCHLAFFLQEAGHRVVVLDLDTQGNASKTLSAHHSGLHATQMLRQSDDDFRAQLNNLSDDGLMLIGADGELADLNHTTLQGISESLQAKLAILADRFDVCLIDTPPSLSVATTISLLAADYVLSPLEMAEYSMDGAQKMIPLIANVRKRNKKLRFLGLLPNRLEARLAHHHRILDQLRETLPDLVMPMCIHNRLSIQQALAHRMPVWKMPGSSARFSASEMQAFAQHVTNQMELGWPKRQSALAETEDEEEQAS